MNNNSKFFKSFTINNLNKQENLSQFQNNSISILQINEQENKITSQIDQNDIHSTLDKALKQTEGDFFMAYKEQMIKFQRSLKIFKNRLDQQFYEQNENDKMNILFQEKEYFKKEALRLDQWNKEQHTQIQQYQYKQKKLVEDNNYYESAILTVKKENKLLKTELLQMYKSKKEEYFAEKKINKIKEPNLNPDQINPISQYSLSEDGILKAQFQNYDYFQQVQDQNKYSQNTFQKYHVKNANIVKEDKKLENEIFESIKKLKNKLFYIDCEQIGLENQSEFQNTIQKKISNILSMYIESPQFINKIKDQMYPTKKIETQKSLSEHFPQRCNEIIQKAPNNFLISKDSQQHSSTSQFKITTKSIKTFYPQKSLKIDKKQLIFEQKSKRFNKIDLQLKQQYKFTSLL